MTNADNERNAASGGAPQARTIDFWPGHPLSYTTTRIQIFRNDIELGSATGFVIKYGQKYALVTNWHVLSGYNPADDSCLSKNGALPNRITCHVAVSQRWEHDGQSAEKIHFKPLVIDILVNGVPIWREDRPEGIQNDCAVIDLDGYVPELKGDDVSLRAISAGRVALKKGLSLAADGVIGAQDVQSIYPPVGAEVFVLGYPKGISTNGSFPLWKRASIASEPQGSITLGGREYQNVFYIDTMTKSGMSASPVVYLAKPGDRLHAEDGAVVEVSKAEPFIVGVYAGRDGITQEEYELSVGRVWKIQFVERLIATPTRIE